MRVTSENSRELVRYLLGQSSETEKAAVEQRYFADAAYLEALEVVETELIDDYLRGRLAADERRHFTEHYLRSPERQRNVQLGAALLRSLSGRRGLMRLWPSSGFLRYGLAATLAFGLMGLIVLVQQRSEFPSAISFVLTPGGLRSGGNPQSLVIPKQASRVRLQLAIDVQDPGRQQRAVLRTVEGQEIWRKEVISSTQPASTTTVNLEMSSEELQPGDYLLQLESNMPDTGFHPVASYFLHVVQR